MMRKVQLPWKRTLLARLPLLGAGERIVRTAKWAQDIRHVHCPVLPKRESLYSHVQSAIDQKQPLVYLEFGVAQGESLKCWCNLNQKPDTRFWGFDTFTGLPEQWNQKAVGTFSNAGAPPMIMDPRVAFCVGLFQQTLPGWLAEHTLYGQLVVHIDCDLYSATL